ncbi:MAG TPA: DUF4241 domain-containing protein [Kofleriaceae bacterium]|nr:DUF4241 domain-containing protein [Kofleriaceae bacterium]
MAKTSKSQKGKAAAQKALKTVKAAGKAAKAAGKAAKAAVVNVVKPTILKAKETVDKKTGRAVVRAIKPAKATKPSMPAPPPPPKVEEPAQRTELAAPRDIARLTRYGERFGANKIDVRWLPIQLPVTSGSLAVMDPGVPKSFKVIDRPVGNGQFRAMLSIARTDDGKERIAAITIHVGRPPITRWTVAHWRGQKPPKSADQLPRTEVSTGWLALLDAGKGEKDSPGMLAVAAANGLNPVEVPLTDGRRALALPCGNGEFVAYWAVDAADKPICLVIDFEAFSQKDWKARPPA